MLRPATETDLSRIVEIYNASIPDRLATADTEPVSVESKLPWFRRHSPESHPILILEEDEKILAWLSFQPFYGRPAYRHTAEISIYIDPAHQGRGLGRQLLDEAIARVPELGLRMLLGFIFAHNEASVRLFRSRGFEEWGQFPNIAEMDDREYTLAIYGRRVGVRAF